MSNLEKTDGSTIFLLRWGQNGTDCPPYKIFTLASKRDTLSTYWDAPSQFDPRVWSTFYYSPTRQNGTRCPNFFFLRKNGIDIIEIYSLWLRMSHNAESFCQKRGVWSTHRREMNDNFDWLMDSVKIWKNIQFTKELLICGGSVDLQLQCLILCSIMFISYTEW